MMGINSDGYIKLRYFWSRKGEENLHRCHFTNEPCEGESCKAWGTLFTFCEEYCPIRNVCWVKRFASDGTACALGQAPDSFWEYGFCRADWERRSTRQWNPRMLKYKKGNGKTRMIEGWKRNG